MSPSQSFSSAAQRSFVIERSFAASIELVFKLWTDPALVSQWWGIKGCTIPHCVLDVRAGGRWRIDMLTASGALYRNQGQYLEVIPNRLLRYRDDPDPELQEWAGKPPGPGVHTVSFEARGAITHVRLEVILATAADRERLLALGMRGGWTESFDRLEAALRNLADR